VDAEGEGEIFDETVGRERMSSLDGDLLYLCSCALEQRIPDADRVSAMDLTKLYELCGFHSLTALAAAALMPLGDALPKEWKEARAKAMRRTILFDAERGKICAFFEEKGIWYLPLKGILLKDYYPSPGLREMADNDILYDSAYQDAVQAFMMENGYKAVSVGVTAHDTYQKPPVFNFELHRMLYNEYDDRTLCAYYKDVRQRLVQDGENSFRFRFVDEDFYLYILSHAYRHYSDEGTGLRSLVDVYVFLKAKGDRVDWHYMEAEAEKMGISDFFRVFSSLGRKLFPYGEGVELTDEEARMLSDLLESGTYGTLEGGVARSIQRTGGKTAKLKYLWKRLFPDLSVYKVKYPFFYRHKWLLPVAWLWRLFSGLFRHGRRILRELIFVGKVR